MLKLSVAFSAFFISLCRILWVNDDHSPKTWTFDARDNSRAFSQTPVPLTLDYKASSRVVGGTPLMFIRPFISHSAWQRITQRAEAAAAGMSYRQSRGGERVRSAETEQHANLLICSFLNVQTKKIFITAFRMLSHCLRVKQSNQTFPSPFSLPPHLHILLQTTEHVLGWQLLRRSGKVLVFGMLHHKQKLLFHRKRKFLKFNFLVKFIFNDQTLSNIMYTCTQQDFLLGKKNLWKESWSK